jgi:hypothetical protein
MDLWRDNESFPRSIATSSAALDGDWHLVWLQIGKAGGSEIGSLKVPQHAQSACDGGPKCRRLSYNDMPHFP